jgi:ABC-type branched-subunit amino acid transport system substrate-binding protein
VQGALATIDQAQEGLPQRVKLELEWIDEDAANLEDEAYRITHDDAYAAIIGPKYSRHARLLARESLNYRIPVIMPSVTSAEIQRIYGGSNKTAPNIFCMSESDLAQTQAMLNVIRKQSFVVDYIYLLSRGTDSDDYVSSFTSYTTFFANELAFQSVTDFVFSDKESLRSCIKRIQAGMSSYFIFQPIILFVPSSVEDMLMLNEVIDEEGIVLGFETGNSNLNDYFPDIVCTDIACSPLLEGKLTHEYQGIALCGDPESGFPAARKAATGREIQSGNAQLYDSFTLLALALAYKETAQLETVREAIVAVMDACDGDGDEFSWTADGLRHGFQTIRAGHIPSMTGASGSWIFDKETHISQLGTWYGIWRYYDGEYHLVEYMTRSDHAKKSSMDQMWDWAADQLMSFVKSYKGVTYEPLEDRCAVVMATSTGWNNYRHQADALDIYRMLKNAGYDDDHIVLIVEDDIADNPENPHPGVVHVTPDGENLHTNIQVDYKISELTPEDFGNILKGNVTERTPQVVHGSKGTNVLLFWSGHGAYDTKINWGADDYIWAAQIHSILQSAQDNFRKLFFVMETCYSGSVGVDLPDIPGLLLLTAAAPGESSHADVIEGNIYLSNAFTRVFREEVEANPSINLYELYTQLARHTTASHAMMYNYDWYGNVYYSTLSEYFQPFNN